MQQSDMVKVVSFLLRAISVAKRIQGQHGKKLTEFNPAVEADPEVHAIRAEVHAFASQYPMPGL